MTPAKGQSSSRRKEKEIASNPPTARDVGEEAVYSKSDHFDDEEARRAPNTERTPLIDPWYDIHAHFPKVPGDYMLPPQYRRFLRFVGFLNCQPRHPPGHFTPRTHSLWIRIGHSLGLEGVGR